MSGKSFVLRRSYIDFQNMKNVISANKSNGPQEAKEDFKLNMTSEIRRVYLHYFEVEQHLFKEMNQRVGRSDHYRRMTIIQLKQELVVLKELVELTSSLADFVNLNVKAIGTIIKRYDKHLKNVTKISAAEILADQMNVLTSDLHYMLNFKIIDQISIIASSLDKKILKESTKMSQSLKNSLTSSDEMEANSIEDHKSLFKEIKRITGEIDTKTDKFRTSAQDWGNKLVFGNQKLDYSVYESNDFRNTFINTPADANLALKLNLDAGYVLTADKIHNLYFLLAANFFAAFFNTYAYLENPRITSKFGFGFEMYLLTVIVFHLTGMAIKLILQYTILKDELKHTYALFCIVAVSGCILHFLAVHFDSFVFLLLSRAMMGLSSFSFIAKHYIGSRVKKEAFVYYNNIYIFSNLVGYILGAVFSITYIYLDADKSLGFDRLTALVMTCIFALILVFSFLFFSRTSVLKSHSDTKEDLARKDVLLQEKNEEEAFFNKDMISKRIETLIAEEFEQFEGIKKSTVLLLGLSVFARFGQEYAVLVMIYSSIEGDLVLYGLICFCITFLLIIVASLLYAKVTKSKLKTFIVLLFIEFLLLVVVRVVQKREVTLVMLGLSILVLFIADSKGVTRYCEQLEPKHNT